MKILTALSRTYFLIISLALLLNTVVISQDNQVMKKKEFGLEKATNLGEPINTSSGEFAPTISADGKTLIFESNRESGWKLYITRKIDTCWTEPTGTDG